MLGTFSLLASRSTCSRYLATVFSLRAFDRARGCSLIWTEAGRPGLPRVLGTLLNDERKFTVVLLLRFVIVFAARDHHVSRRCQLTLEAVRTGRERPAQIVIAGASEVHLHRAKIDDRLILTECRKPQETWEVAIRDCWSSDRSRGDSQAVYVFQRDGQCTVVRG